MPDAIVPAPTFVYESKFEHGDLVLFATDHSLHKDHIYAYYKGQLVLKDEPFRGFESLAVGDSCVLPGYTLSGDDLKRLRLWLEQLNAVGYAAHSTQSRWHLGAKS